MERLRSIDKEKFREAIRESGWSQAAICKVLKLNHNTITTALSRGRLDEDVLERICMIIDANPSDFLAQHFDPPAEEKKDVQPASSVENQIQILTKYVLTISDYLLCTVNNQKKQTEQLDEIGKMMAELMTQVRQINENERNCAVTQNKLMNNIFNQMKYGRAS